MFLKINLQFLNNFRISNGAMLLISGWGHLKEGGHSSEQLKKVEVPIVSNRDCDQVYSFNIIKDMLCAGIAGKDSCQVGL